MTPLIPAVVAIVISWALLVRARMEDDREARMLLNAAAALAAGAGLVITAGLLS